MPERAEEELARELRRHARPLTGAREDFDDLIHGLGGTHYVLIGEASHGTHEFYQRRAELTQRLIQEAGFTVVAVEADWPDAYRANRFVRGQGNDATALAALADFERFPLWMWRNREVLAFLGWLRQHNDRLPAGAPRVGFYGLDLYSLFRSIGAVLAYLDKVDPEAARRARYRYSCLDRFGEDTQAYGYAASFGLTETCEREVIEQLVDLQRRAGEYAHRDGRVAEDDFFFAEQNARLVKNAEEYYRTMFGGRVASWNLRDTHMADTLDALAAYLNGRGRDTRVVVWAHNSHLGDARATEMGATGEINVGQLVRQRHGREARLIGLTTYTGTVTAASDWDAPAERKFVNPGLPGSFEALFHQVGLPAFGLELTGEGVPSGLNAARLERAIGVVYLPRSERISHYFQARIADQFDYLLHFDRTQALEPLERTAAWEHFEPPETYPFAV